MSWGTNWWSLSFNHPTDLLAIWGPRLVTTPAIDGEIQEAHRQSSRNSFLNQATWHFFPRISHISITGDDSHKQTIICEACLLHPLHPHTEPGSRAERRIRNGHFPLSPPEVKALWQCAFGFGNYLGNCGMQYKIQLSRVKCVLQYHIICVCMCIHVFMHMYVHYVCMYVWMDGWMDG